MFQKNQPASANKTSAEATVPTNTDIMEAIAQLSGSFNRKFDDLSSTLIELNVSIANITSRVAATEETAEVHETRIESLEETVCTPGGRMWKT